MPIGGQQTSKLMFKIHTTSDERDDEELSRVISKSFCLSKAKATRGMKNHVL
jgi:hypothetical protein